MPPDPDFTPPEQAAVTLSPAHAAELLRRLEVAEAERNAARRDAREALRHIEAGVLGEAIRFIRRAAGEGER